MSAMNLDLTAVRQPVASRIVLRGKQVMGIVALWRERMRYRDELSRLGERDWQDFGLSRSTAKFEMSKRLWSA